MRGAANTRILVLGAGFVGLVAGLSLNSEPRGVDPAAAGPVYTPQAAPIRMVSGAVPAVQATPQGILPVYYEYCSQARAAGVAPILRGQPGYREGLDGDLDGIACEPMR